MKKNSIYLLIGGAIIAFFAYGFYHRDKATPTADRDPFKPLYTGAHKIRFVGGYQGTGAQSMISIAASQTIDAYIPAPNNVQFTLNGQNITITDPKTIEKIRIV